MENLRAVIYIRISDPSQIDNNSLETQLKACQTFADTKGYEVVEIFREEGVSAKHINTRPEMRRLMSYCTTKSNRISKVIIYKMDRWTRNLEEGLYAITILAKSGIGIEPATEITEQNAMGKAMRSILMALGELDNNLKGERVHDNMKTMFKNGLWCWKPPVGYTRPKGSREETKGKPPILDTNLSKIVSAMFLKASESPCSKKYLADYMNQLGWKQFYGKKADGKLVAQIVRNSFYYKYMFAPKWNEYQWGEHEALTDKLIWDKANVNVFGRKRKLNAQDSTIFPLKGSLNCATCGHPMTSSNPKGRNKNYLYYECHNKACTKQERIDIDGAHEQFLNILSGLRPTKRALRLFSQLVFEEWDTSINQSKNEAKLLDEQVSMLEGKLTSIAESASKGILTDEEAKSRADDIRNEITVLRVERSDIRISQYDTEAVRNFTENFLLNLDNLWLQLELPQKQALHLEIFPEGLVADNRKVRTTKLASSFELIRALDDPNYDLVSRVGIEPTTKSLKGSCSTAELSARRQSSL